jgi:hypothetical protein
MEYIIFLFLGGFIEWLLLGYLVFQIMRGRRVELQMIEEISQELKIVKQEITELKSF